MIKTLLAGVGVLAILLLIAGTISYNTSVKSEKQNLVDRIVRQEALKGSDIAINEEKLMTLDYVTLRDIYTGKLNIYEYLI